MVHLLVLCCRIVFVYLSSAFIIVHTSPMYCCSWTYNWLCLSLPGRCLTPFVSCGACPRTYFWEPQAVLPVKACRVQRGEDGQCPGCLATRCLRWCALGGPRLLQHWRLHGLQFKHESLFKLCSAHLISWLHWLACRPPASRWCQKVFMLRF